jgi:hypothetical protein
MTAEEKKSERRWARDTIAEGLGVFLVGVLLASVELEDLVRWLAYCAQALGILGVLLGCYNLARAGRDRCVNRD